MPKTIICPVDNHTMCVDDKCCRLCEIFQSKVKEVKPEQKQYIVTITLDEYSFYIKELYYPVTHSALTQDKKKAQRFLDSEYIREKFRDTPYQDCYRIEVV